MIWYLLDLFMFSQSDYIIISLIFGWDLGNSPLIDDLISPSLVMWSADIVISLLQQSLIVYNSSVKKKGLAAMTNPFFSV